MNFRIIEKLIEQSQSDLPNKILEGLQETLEGHKECYYRFLYLLVAELQPDVCLEIGVSHGVGSLHMAWAAQKYGGMVIGIDKKYHHFPGEFLANKYNYHFLHGDSTSPEIIRQVKGLVENSGSIGIVFQDSSHHYLASVKEWDIYSQLLDLRAVWICDDITPDFYDPNFDPPGKSMVSYFNWLPGEKRLYDNLHFGSRVGIVLL